MSNKSNKHLIVTISSLAMCLLAASNNVCAQVPCGGYEVTAIVSMEKCPPFGVPPVLPLGINEQGWMVGYFNPCVIGANRAWLWTPDDGLVVIPTPAGTTSSRALAISGSKIVGHFDNTKLELGTTGFLYDFETDEFTSLGTLPGADRSEAYAINGSGEIVGFWQNTQVGPKQGFIFVDGIMQSLGDDLGTPNSQANHINTIGLVTGWMGQSSTIDARAFIWDDGKVTELPPISGGFTSVAEAISIDTRVIGWGLREEGKPAQIVTRAFHWQDGEMLDLGTLPDHLRSGALGMRISPLEIVGLSWNVQGNPNIMHAVIWNNEGLHDLNDLVCRDEILNFMSARAINQTGQIAVQAVDQFNDTVAVLLTPNKKPQGDLDNDCVVSVSDLLVLFSSWGTCENCVWCSADLDQNCAVGVSDLLILFANWG